NPTWCPWAGHLALAVAEEDPRRARALTARMLRRAERFGTPTAIGEALGFSAAVAEAGQALPLRERAVETLRRSPSRHLYAEALIELGAELGRTGRTDRAAGLLTEGIELADRCGAGRLAERGRAERAGMTATTARSH